MWSKKHSTVKRDVPLASLKSFRRQKFFQTPKSSQRVFLVSWNKKNRRKNVLSPSHPWKVVSARNFLKKRRVRNEIIRYCVTKIFRRKKVISLFLIQTISSLPEFYWNNKKFTMNFSKLWDKKSDRKTWYLLLSFSHPYNSFAARSFLKHRRVLNELFR